MTIDEGPRQSPATGLFQVLPGGKMPVFSDSELICTPEEARRAGIRYVMQKYSEGLIMDPTLLGRLQEPMGEEEA